MFGYRIGTICMSTIAQDDSDNEKIHPWPTKPKISTGYNSVERISPIKTFFFFFRQTDDSICLETNLL